jgi:hypothetical protein
MSSIPEYFSKLQRKAQENPKPAWLEITVLTLLLAGAGIIVLRHI